MPVRNVPRLAFLVDGRVTMLEMCLAFLRARYSIYITAWGLSPELLLVRGKHKCAGSPDSPEQEALLQWLRAKGFSEEELLFWQQCDELSVTNVLKHAVSKGVDVRVLLWDTYTPPSPSFRGRFFLSLKACLPPLRAQEANWAMRTPANVPSATGFQ
jgi:phosphatidylserine/phosphatidylglycerophosphate/cardiolipin synthase-like enzyme